jgi:hypothetical protein
MKNEINANGYLMLFKRPSIYLSVLWLLLSTVTFTWSSDQAGNERTEKAVILLQIPYETIICSSCLTTLDAAFDTLRSYIQAAAICLVVAPPVDNRLNRPDSVTCIILKQIRGMSRGYCMPFPCVYDIDGRFSKEPTEAQLVIMTYKSPVPIILKLENIDSKLLYHLLISK